jgi:signal recognition particle GTPase
MNFLESLAKQFAGKPIDWDELEETLIRADLGVPMTMRIIKTLQEREAKRSRAFCRATRRQFVERPANRL